MKITLVTASFNDVVHGTFNDKKTGCGINLLKPDIASRFHRGGDMTYLGEITCEKCKAKIAKEMIKADSKEMKALLKEEKMRAKRGLEDEGLVNLSELEQKPTSRYVEPRKPASPPVTPDVQANQNNSAYTEPPVQQYEPVPPVAETEEDDFLKQFSIQKPEVPQFEEEKPEEDDFLKQFSIQKPEMSQFEEEKPEEDDFLSQFSISPEQKNEYQPETPAQPPVIDDISDAISAMNNINTQPEQEDMNNDILSMFAVDSSQATSETNTDYNSYDDDESIFDSMKSDDITENSSTNEWDIIANQLFADTSGNAKQSQPEFDDISVPEIEDIKVPSLDDISAPEIEDIKTPSLDDISIDDIIAPTQSVASSPVQQPQEITPPPVQQMTPPPVQQMTPPPVQQMTPPPVQQMTPPPVQQMTPPPVQQMTPPPVQQMTPPPVQQMTPPPIQQMAPPPMPQMTAGIGQVITVPQITGYDQNGQPMYAYAQMLVQGYDQNGQPILMPISTQPIMGMPMPAMTMQQQQPEYSSLNKNSRLQSLLNELDAPVSEKEMTVGQKIAAADAKKGSPVTANVSKIATNPHAKAANQAFISAISESKDATQSLTETQGLKSKGPVLDSIEDVLSQLGDNSLKEKKAAQAKVQQNVPVYQEYKTPARSSSSSFSRPVPSSRTSSSSMSDMPLTKAQLKEKKKQDKIDAKFQKDMEKRRK